jgi:aspartyl protease family protein
MRAAAAAVLLCAVSGAPLHAQTVSMSGSLGDKALLMIDGTPRTVAAGSTVHGVKLVSVTGHEAVVEVKGRRQTLTLGGAQVNIGGAPSDGGGSQIVLTAGSGGHFFSDGSINGRAVRFVVDTGATYVSMGSAEAARLGIDFKKGQRGTSGTANGQIVVYRVSLASVRVGDVVVYNVDAVVSEAPSMDFILLGNSFLARFQMRRDNDVMTLNKRF